MKHFFLSYSTADTEWAEWIYWELEAFGYTVIAQRWDFEDGHNFALQMHSAIKQSERLLLVLSRSSLDSKFVAAEWAAFFARDPNGSERRIIPIKVDDCRPDGLLGQIVWKDLTGLPETEARALLHAAVVGPGAKRRTKPLFPGTKPAATGIPGPRYPGSVASGSTQAADAILRNYLSSNLDRRLPSIRQRSLGKQFLQSHLDALIEREQMRRQMCSAIVLDVDGMSGINTRFGIEVGDAVIERLLSLAESLKQRLLVARVGDDTLLVVVVKVGESAASDCAKKLIRIIARAEWSAIAAGLYVKCSAGYADFDEREPAFTCVKRAAEGQYMARKAGGNSAIAGLGFVDPSDIEAMETELKREAFRRELAHYMKVHASPWRDS
jgi:diguanylate cyclase (GGDEF)-like protein